MYLISSGIWVKMVKHLFFYGLLMLGDWAGSQGHYDEICCVVGFKRGNWGL